MFKKSSRPSRQEFLHQSPHDTLLHSPQGFLALFLTFSIWHNRRPSSSSRRARNDHPRPHNPSRGLLAMREGKREGDGKKFQMKKRETLSSEQSNGKQMLWDVRRESGGPFNICAQPCGTEYNFYLLRIDDFREKRSLQTRRQLEKIPLSLQRAQEHHLRVLMRQKVRQLPRTLPPLPEAPQSKNFHQGRRIWLQNHSRPLRSQLPILYQRKIATRL